MTLPITPVELPSFLVRAKIATYASGNDNFAVSPVLQISQQLEYGEENFLYRDIYYGGMHFIGLETVFQLGKPLWGMSYYGGVLPKSDKSQISAMPDVLKAALRKVPIENPYRGPKTFQKGDYLYQNEFHGEFTSFYGVEIIHFQEQVIYKLRYNGGIVD